MHECDRQKNRRSEFDILPRQFDNPHRVYDNSTTIQQIEPSMTKIASVLAENVRKRQKVVPVAASLDGSQPNFAAIVYAGRPTSWRRTAEIGRVLFEQI